MKIITGVLIAVLFFVWLNLDNVRTGYEINKLEKKKTELVNYNRILNIEISKLRSLERIESVARKDLNLTTPDKFETLALVQKEEEKKGIFNKMFSFVLSIF
jgi:cell division protein FtsL